ncbi:MAG TPA: response regulator transcription factor [Ktedonobacterales bacterium]|nr:response regulator transcription factor [Ktedonobacterales bacterium]
MNTIRIARARSADDMAGVLMKEDETMARKTQSADSENPDAQPGLTDASIETGEPIRVMLADDHVLVREGTRRLLEAESDIEVIAEAGDGISAVEQAIASQPDVLIIDVAMPGMSGIEATRQIKQQLPKVAVLALTAYDDDQYVLALINAGAAGFMLKDVRGQELVTAVRSVHRGEQVLQPAIAVRALRQAVSSRSPIVSMPPLSDREMEVLREAARGLPNKDIARRLNLSVRTIHTHLGNIFAKLGVGSRTEAVLLALRRGWIALDDTEHPDLSVAAPVTDVAVDEEEEEE